ncbi:unnamed protein product [Rotaria sp. Silwood1]|nr:unnamed protein product [Rotaria sp. Silwood1]CAF1581296.1 unnamed protein product [Rotaria sp. Silwood1]CAF3629228.1 unnamed protein product [Rotaria sp. Silwood1]CAF4867057.1 unnamed protein product [Rotaria sp. Silwood1]
MWVWVLQIDPHPNNYVTSSAAGNIFQQHTITWKSLETFTITHFHLNASTTIGNHQTHDINLIDTNQYKNKAHSAQPKTLLILDIEPGNRYELVCTTEAGLIRYRMGDVVTCTGFFCRSDDLVPLPIDHEEVPRIPLFSIAYRIGSLLDAFGEKTSEQHLMDALQRTSQQWKEQGIPLDIYDFTSYPKLDVFPSHYVLFFELIEEQNSKREYKTSEKNLQLFFKP